jgi:putative DNA primase/helicase
VNEIAAELEAAGDDKEEREALKKRTDAAMRELTWALKSEDAKRIDALLKMARTDPGIVAPVEQFDADPFALNVLNGTLDLRTGKLNPHDRADYITKLAPVAYNLAANAPTWDRLLTGMWDGDMELIGWNQRFAGYAATGDVREQIVAIFHGTGGNGKSTYVETLLDALGDYAYKANAELLLASKSDRHETEKAALVGRRFVAACETGEGRRLNEPLVKETTGGDRITARFMKQDHFTFPATFKVALSTNHRPEIRGTDVGIWRRVRLVPFNVRFWKPGETPGPEHLRADPTMRDKLRGELPGVLNWIVAGAVEWFRDGLGTCKAVEAATADYRSAEDIVSQWFDEWCERDAGAETKGAALFSNYVAWSEARKEKPLTQTMFGSRLGGMGFDKRKSNGVVYMGVRLKSG